jgi:glycerophosphoryl diester phosphodiesterase
MKIIGHRGAAGLALENTLESIRAAIDAGVDAIEFDIRLTSDGQFVVIHDQTLSRVSRHHHIVKEMDSDYIADIVLHNGERLPTLAEALQAAGDTPVIIETKGSGWAPPLAKFLKNYRSVNATVISFNHRELGEFAKLQPTIPTFAIERTKPFDAIQYAKQNRFTGVDMNFWLLNPLTYWMARRKGLEIIVYTVNHRWIAWYLNLLFPKAAITTNHPHNMQFLRPKQPKRGSKGML